MMLLASRGPSVSNPSFVAFLVVMACDAVFIGYFSFRKMTKARAGPRQRARLSIIGIVLQMVACAVVANVRRWPTQPLWPMPVAAEIALAALAAALAVASVWLCLAAVVTLGKQWTFVAQVGEGHELVTSGPYALVRHPIYAGMSGLVIASALVVTQWRAVPIAVALQLGGTWVRVREEERLLRAEHGQAFEAYAARVPAIVPRVARMSGG
jgi:protein-S-isoprenylcysteine O-methyltransferase Ste14